MRSRAAVVLVIALALPALAQRNMGHGGGSSIHGGAPAHYGSMNHAGSMRPGGFSGHPAAPGYSSMVGIQRPSSFSPPGTFPLPARLQPPARNGVALPYGGHGFSGSRSPYSNHYPYRYPYHDHDHGHGHHDGHHRAGYVYPGLYGYPYYSYPVVIDPGFYDWGDSDYSDDQPGANANFYPNQAPGYTNEPPYPDEGAPQYQPQRDAYNPPPPAAAPVQVQEYHFADPNSASTAGPPLTVIFKGDRTPLKMQNFMVNSAFLTDLDREHFEKIPLDEVDIAATQQTNRRHGIDFRVPIPSSD